MPDISPDSDEEFEAKMKAYWAEQAALAKPATEAPCLVESAINQNATMREELAHVGNLVSDLARLMRVDLANDDGSWPDLAGRIERLKSAFASPEAEPDPRYGKVHADGSRSGGQPPEAERGLRDNEFLKASREIFGITQEEQYRRARSAAAALQHNGEEQS